VNKKNILNICFPPPPGEDVLNSLPWRIPGILDRREYGF
jgi:hypothetical protein